MRWGGVGAWCDEVGHLRSHAIEEHRTRLGLFQRVGFAALFITHSIYEAVFLSTRVLVMGSRPGKIVGDFAIPFPYPRSPDLRFEPEFAELSGQVSHALRGAHT